MTMKKSLAVALALAASVLSTSCTINAPARTAPALYDLGTDAAATDGRYEIPGTLLIPQVGSPPWLDTTGIVYRLAYQDPRRLRAYNESRWVATPAMLLTEELRSRFSHAVDRVVSGADGAQADHALRVELEDYSQVFAAPDSSRVVVRARASLVNRKTREVEAQKTFGFEREAGPDAAGAANALASSTDELVANLLDWVAQNRKNSAAASPQQRSER